MHRKWMVIALVGLVALPLGCGSRVRGAAGKLAAGEVFPDFKVKTLDGQKEVSLTAYRGKIVILDLFATWCPPCRMEIPHLVELQKKHAEDLTVIGLSYDQGSGEKVSKFIQDMHIDYPVFWGNGDIARHVGLRGIPHMLVLDQQGKVVRSYVGYQPPEVFEADILALSGASKEKETTP